MRMRTTSAMRGGVWLLLFLSIVPTVEGVVQTLRLEWTRSSAPTESKTSSMLVSKALFGPLPSMHSQENPRLTLQQAPFDDPLLCLGNSSVSYDDNSKTDAAGIMLLVPRGTCAFERKVLHAERMGAAAVLIYGTLDSLYRLNTTNRTADYDYSEKDIVFPAPYYDYDCSRAEAWIESSRFSFDPLPYNAGINDPILSSGNRNECFSESTDSVRSNADQCPSDACVLTGNTTTRLDSASDTNQTLSQACCAWDLSLFLYPDATLVNETVTIPSAYLTMTQGQALLEDLQSNSQVTAVLTNRWRPAYNASSILIWLLGVGVAALAAWLTASDYRSLTTKLLQQQERRRRRQAGSSDDSSRPRNRRQAASAAPRPPPPDEVLELTAAHALGFIVMASTSLLVLFYFKIYRIVKVFYAFGCSTAVAQVIFQPLLAWILRRTKKRDTIVWRTGTEDFGDITFCDVLAFACGYALGLAWLVTAFVVRQPDRLAFFWILQDVFGACMCITFLKVIRLNSIRVATILLLVAFFYDIFFVFVTPLLFQSGKSVMITVATSGGPPKADAAFCERYPDDANCQGGDPLPMLLTIPRLFDYLGGSSMLGLGDIVLPGLLLSFCARFDAAKSLLGVLGGGSGGLQHSYSCPEQRYCHVCYRGGYFLPLCTAYAFGLLLANLAVFYMQMGQPALLYLVPSCLGTLGYIGWRKREWTDLWDGPKALLAADQVLYGESASQQQQVQPQPSTAHAPLPVQDDDDDDNDELVMQVPSALDEEEQQR